MNNSLIKVLTGLTGGALAAALWAQGTATRPSFKVGLVVPLSGPLANTGREIELATRAHFDALNAAGGVRGRQIELIVKDDASNGETAAAAAQDVMKQGATALLSCFGTVSCLAVAKAANAAAVPLIAPIAGAESLRAAEQKQVFAMRASAFDEVSRLLDYLNGIGIKELSLVVQQDGFGRSYRASFERAAQAKGMRIKTEVALDPAKPDYQAAGLALRTADTSAIVLLANTLHSSKTVKAATERGYAGMFLNLAGQANGAYVKNLAGAVTASGFVTLVPSPFDSRSSAAVEYRAQLKNSAATENPSYVGMEAFLNAKLLAEALRRTASSRSGDVALAMTGITDLDLGGMNVSFAKSRQGGRYTDLAVLAKDGRFRHD